MAPKKKTGETFRAGDRDRTRAEKTNSAFPSGESGVVVGQVVQDGKSPVKLFGKE